MDKKEQRGRQAFFDDVATYQYIREDGRLDLESFCVYLSHCFGFDGILELSPQPRDVYMRLIHLIREQLGDKEANEKIQFQNVKNWHPELANIYPEKRITCIHVGALIPVAHYWIYDIGHVLMGIPEPEKVEKYFAWVKEEWLAVYTFIDGFHNALGEFQKRFDLEGISSRGYSMLEALHVARAKDIEFDAAVTLLKTRHDSYRAAMGQISKALQDGYYLEAIALEECLISNCLFNFLDSTGTALTNPSFHTLLKDIMGKQDAAYDFPRELLDNLNKWRRARNNAIHGFITSRSEELNLSRANFLDLTKATALQGEDFCKSVVTWYEVECVNFIRHEFPREQVTTKH